ncbi:MAG: hypothetical protein KJ606_06470 [Chloroflexi bacterium]|nr:hypothetical protein [Chloroflexota bacterium]
MPENPLKSLEAYNRFVARIFDSPQVEHSTVAVWSDSPFTGTAEGEVFFSNGIRLRIREELDFEAGIISSYGYEAYRGEERIFWYDDFPHPNDQALAATFPHHKHIPPDIKRHRIPASEMSFKHPNLPFILQEILEIG